MQDHRLLSTRLSREDKRARKFVPGSMPRNPLKSLEFGQKAIITLTKVALDVVWLSIGANHVRRVARPRFTDKTAAREAVEKSFGRTGPVCPHCGNADAARIAKLDNQERASRPALLQGVQRPVYSDGRIDFRAQQNTLTKWWLAAHLIGSSKKGISSHQLHRMLRVSYKSTWFMMHRFREAMRVGGLAPMGGEGSTVEIDETFIAQA